MREWDSLIEDQGQLGSCSGNAVTNAYELQVRRLYPDKFVELSRLFVYYNSRWLDNLVMEDAGAYIRDSMKALKQFGVCSEPLWPYNVNKFTVRPTDACYTDGLTRTITSYKSLQSTNDVLHAVNDNMPVIIGITVYDSFNKVSKHNSVIQPPTSRERYSGGGHAMTIVGYNLPKQQFLVKNSFGTNWGDRGYAWLPFDYTEGEVFEKWVFDISEQT